MVVVEEWCRKQTMVVVVEGGVAATVVIVLVEVNEWWSYGSGGCNS